MTALAPTTVSPGYACQAPSRTSASEMNAESPGRPMAAKKARPVTPVYTGMIEARPPKPAISRWWARS